MRSVGLLLIIVSNETSNGLLHGAIFHRVNLLHIGYSWPLFVGQGYCKCLHSPNLNLKTRCGV